MNSFMVGSSILQASASSQLFIELNVFLSSRSASTRFVSLILGSSPTYVVVCKDLYPIFVDSFITQAVMTILIKKLVSCLLLPVCPNSFVFLFSVVFKLLLHYTNGYIQHVAVCIAAIKHAKNCISSEF